MPRGKTERPISATREDCASDGEGLHPGLGSLPESFIGRLAAQAAVGAVVVVEVLPFLELVVEHLGVVDDHAVEQSVELLGVDAMGALHLELWSESVDEPLA
jgi:hypothetical protein